MRVAILAPPNMLTQYSVQSTYHLTLLHLYGDPLYKEFYSSRYKEGDWVILDNGANEGVEVDDEALVNAAFLYGASEVVAPDQPRDGIASTNRTLAFVLKYGSRLREGGILIMGAPQGSNPLQWFRSFNLMLPFVDSIGVSKKVEEFACRVSLVEIIAPLCYPKQIHLLGADAIPGRVRLYEDLPNVRGIDTQKMVAAGLNGVTLNLNTHKTHAPSVNLGRVFDVREGYHEIVQRNIERFREWASDK